jgi:hypothetical protein
MKGIYRTGAPLVHVPGWMGGWMDGWMGGSKSGFKDCLQQSKIDIQIPDKSGFWMGHCTVNIRNMDAR